MTPPLSTPHVEFLLELQRYGVPVIDLSADFMTQGPANHSLSRSFRALACAALLSLVAQPGRCVEQGLSLSGLETFD